MMMRLVLCGIVLLFLSPPASPSAPSDFDQSCLSETVPVGTVVLLDSYNYVTLPWNAIDIDNDNNTWEIMNTSSICRQVAQVCSLDQGSQNNLLVTQFISKSSTASAINVVVEFEPSTCSLSGDSSGTCQSINVSLHIYNSAMEDVVGAQNFNNFISLVNFVTNTTAIPVVAPEKGFYLAFQDMGSCSLITRVRVTHTICSNTSNNFTVYPQANSGQNVTGECVADSNPIGSSMLSAQCLLNSSFDFSMAGDCQCNAGYEPIGNQCNACPRGSYKQSSGNTACTQCPMNSDNTGTASINCTCNMEYIRGNPVDIATNCSQCATDHFLVSNGMCVRCPLMSTSVGMSTPTCTCNANMSTSEDLTTTAMLPCTSCIANYYKSGSACVACPFNSERVFNANLEGLCFCKENSATNMNSRNTTGLQCDGCATDFFMRSSNPPTAIVCSNCPTNSMSVSYMDTSCTCTTGAVLEGTTNLTTTDVPCSGCAVNYFRINNNIICTVCPANSARVSTTDPDTVCNCNTDFSRVDDTAVEERCVPIAGFTSESITLTEGNRSINLVRSVAFDEAVNTPVVLNPVVPGVTVSVVRLMFARMSTTEMIPISSVDDNIALEPPITFSLRMEKVPQLDIGGSTSSGMLFGEIEVTISDDDVVDVGFTTSTVSYNESASNPTITLTRLQPIASNFQVRIIDRSKDKSSSPISISDGAVVVTFSPTDAATDTITVPFMITRNSVGGQEDIEVMLGLEYVGPSESKPFVRLGGGSTESSITVVILDDDSSVPPTPFPLEGIIGVCAAGAGLAVLLLVIVILCLCICRMKVNRQGFYPTYEDKTSEPPTMLRYSASLRSISSQTVVPITEGRAVKESEFYV